MSQQSQEPPKIQTKNEGGNYQKSNVGGREYIAYSLGAVGTIAFVYVTFFDHDISLWIAFFGGFIVLTGIVVGLHGKVKSTLLYPILFILVMILLLVTLSLRSGNKPSQTSTTLIVSKDSLQSTKAFLISAESTMANANHKLALAQKYFEVGNKPYIDISINDVVLEKGAPISLNLKLENIGKSPAYHFFNMTRLCIDSVTDNDSIDVLTIAKRHKRDNVSPLVKEFNLTKTLFHSLSETQFSYFSNKTLFVLGAISYYDDPGKYHLFFFCYKLLKNKYEDYAKYNSGH